MNANNDEGKLISGKEALDSYFESQVCEESDDPKWVDLKECKYSVSQILKEKDQRISCHISLKFRLASSTMADEVKQHWISVKEQVPKIGESVLVCMDTKYIGIDRYIAKHGFVCFGWYENSVTHWMPLPAPPAQGDKP